MVLRNNKIHKVALTSLIAIFASSGLAVAQSNDKVRNVFTDEVIVTAQKRDQNLQDVGIAVTAVTGDQMRSLGFTNAQEITALAPGVSTIQPNGEANYAIGIRGVVNNDFITNVESPIAVYVDEVYISQMSGAGFALFDMERAEILRGPQGTLFGRNATGGLVQYVTVKPSQEFGGYGGITYGEYNHLQVEGAVNVPLTDRLSMRVSGTSNQRDGYITNRLNPNQNLNNANDFAGRLQLLWEGDEWDALLNVRQGRQDIRTGFFQHVSTPVAGTLQPTVPNLSLNKTDGTRGYIDNDNDPYAGDYDRTGHNDLETKGYSLTLNGDIGGLDFTSITDFSTTERDYIEDSDASPENYFNFFLTTDAEQLSQEFRLAGETDNARWVAGAYYLDLKVDDSNGAIMPGFFSDFYKELCVGFSEDPAARPITGQTIGGVSGTAPGTTACAPPLTGLTLADLEVGGPAVSVAHGLVNPYTTETESLSLFGQWEQDISNDLTFIAGGRVIKEEKSHNYQNIEGNFSPLATSGADSRTVRMPAAITYIGTRDDTEWAARLQLDWRPSDDTLYYASWNRGVKSGGFNAPLLPTVPGGYPTPTVTSITAALTAANAAIVAADRPNASALAATITAGTTPAALATAVAANTALNAAELAGFRDFMEYAPEQLDAFEVGFKREYNDGLLTVNGAAFYYDYQDYQAFSILGLDTFTRNATAESYGFELEVQSSPAPGLDMLFGVGYVNTEVTDIPGVNSTETPDAYAARLAPGGLAGVAGKAVNPVQTPEWNLNALVRYETPVSALQGNVAFQLSAEYRDEHYFNLANVSSLTEDGYTLLNGSISYYPAATEDVTLMLGVKNLTDEEYIVQGFDLGGTLATGGFFGMTEHYYGQPRMWNLSLHYLF